VAYLKIGDITPYNRSFALSNTVWNIVVKWDYFSKKTIGTQFVDAVDSVSANIAEGFGRYHKKDKIKFYHYAKGSVLESFDWSEKAYVRKLINEKEYSHINENLKFLPKEINHLIKFTNEKLDR